jgi:RNA polymerase sigma factor (sigma-70 family)
MEQSFTLKVTGFFRTERSKMINFIKKRISDESSRDAEDIMQDVMLKIYDLADINIPLEKLSAYVYTALRNRIVDAFRSRKPQESIEELDEQDEFALASVIHGGHESAVENKQYYGEVYRAIDSLADEEKALVIATEFEDVTFRELSEEWDVPIGTLLSRKKRALDKIKNILVKGGFKNEP